MFALRLRLIARPLLLAACMAAGSMFLHAATLAWDFENAISVGSVSTSIGSSDSPAISGVMTQTGGGPVEHYTQAYGLVLLTRHFPTNYPYISITTTKAFYLNSVAFLHVHNHNFSTTQSYNVQLQLDTGSGFMNIGAPVLMNAANTSTTSTVQLQTLLPPGSYQIRFSANGFPNGGSDTGTDFFGLTDVVITATDASTLRWNFNNATSVGRVSTSIADSDTAGLSGFFTQTGGGPVENYSPAQGNVLMTREFPNDYPYLAFTSTKSVYIGSISFVHVHNHNFSTDTSYNLQLQIDVGNGFVDIGAPIPLSKANTGATALVPLERTLGPGTYKIRFTANGFPNGGTTTGTDFLGLDDVVIAASQVSALQWNFDNATSAGRVSTSIGSSDSATLSGVFTQTGGGPVEDYSKAQGNVLMTREFPNNYPYVTVTSTQPVYLDSISFVHVHNHNFATDTSYDLQLQIDTGSGYTDVGAPIRLSAANTGTTSTVPLQTILGGTDKIRFIATNFPNGGTSTGTDFLGLDDVAIAVSPAPLTIVNGASFDLGRPIAQDGIVTAFGSGLATQSLGASQNLTTNLGGTTVSVTDSAGTARLAPLFFVSTGQVNLLLPQGTAPGFATVRITSADGTVTSSAFNVSAVSPAIFSLNGNGLTAANVLRVSNGVQTYENVYQLSAGGLVALPIDLGPSSDSVYLVIYGTGLRHAQSFAVQIGGVSVPVSFGGAQGAFAGLDQVNVGPIPRSLAGQGQVEVDVSADGARTNSTYLTFR